MKWVTHSVITCADIIMYHHTVIAICIFLWTVLVKNTRLLACLCSCLLSCVLACLHTYIHAYLLTYLLTYLLAHSLTHSLTHLPIYLLFLSFFHSYFTYLPGYYFKVGNNQYVLLSFQFIMFSTSHQLIVFNFSTCKM